MTAVEKILYELETKFNELHNGSLVTKKDVLISIEEIKELFEQQIKDAYNQGFRDASLITLHRTERIEDTQEAQNYYNETFKNEN